MNSGFDSGTKSYGASSEDIIIAVPFSVIGMLLQIPVMYTYSGLFTSPNVPVFMMSLYYFYYMLSSTIAVARWSGGDMTKWWNGNGWCDLDSRMKLALSLGALSAQCVINWNIISMLRFRPQREKKKEVRFRTIWQLCACIFLPCLNLAVGTFTTYNRYEVIQSLGCNAQLDGSVAVIVTNFMWIPLLGAISFFTILFIAYRFWKQGSAKTMQHVSFVPNMSKAQFCRIILFACVVTFLLMPLSVAVAAVNFTSIRFEGVQPLAWAHGKPKGWDIPSFVNFAEMAAASDELTYVSEIVMAITLYLNIAISWLIFICYGTGSLAIHAYKSFVIFILTSGGLRKRANTDLICEQDSNNNNGNHPQSAFYGSRSSKSKYCVYSVSQNSDSETLTASSDIVSIDGMKSSLQTPLNDEWDSDINDMNTFKQWEIGSFGKTVTNSNAT